MTLEPEQVHAVVPCHLVAPSPDLLAAIASRVGRVVVVDDGLSDGEVARLRGDGEVARLRGDGEVARLRGDVEVVRLGGNHGKGTAVRRGIERVLGRDGADGTSGDGLPDAVLLMDADGQHPPEAIPAFLAAAATAELVVGDRLGDRAAMPLHRRAGNVLAARAMRRVTGRGVADTQCGMRLLRGRALHDVSLPEGGFEAETIHLKRCLQAGVPVGWVPIPAIYDGEPSAFRHVRDSARIAAALLTAR